MSKSVALALATGTVLLASIMSVAAPADAAPGQRVDFKMLLVSENGNEPSYDAWRSELRREGVPFDVVVATAGHAPITPEVLAAGARAKYQAVVFTNGRAASGLSVTETAAVESFETTFGIRQVTGYVYPSAAYGLNSPTSAGSMAGVVGSLTSEGKSTFPYLVGPVPYAAEAYGYLATPCFVCVGKFTTLVSGPGGSALVGVYRHPSGREELVATADSNPSMIHSQLLRHGMLSWVTKGVYLGDQRNYLGLQIDDIFYDDDRWDEVNNTTPEPSPNPIRMKNADVTRAVNWMASKNLRLEMVFNGGGASSTDPLTKALLNNKNKFGWINHTWSHEQLDNATLAVIDEQIQKNIVWARANKLSINKGELVTGEHSGLANPNMPQALRDSGIKWIAADNSRQPTQYALGPALTVPRYPTNVYYNAATRSEQLDEYNYLYTPAPGGVCLNTQVTTCRSTPATWEEYTGLESSNIFAHLMANDPRPHYFHQSNLAEDGIFYDVVNKAVDRYRSYFVPPIVQLSFSDGGVLLSMQSRWNDAAVAGSVTAYALDDRIYVQTSATLDVPLTGTTSGSAYGGENSGWTTVNSGAVSAFTPAKAADPVNTTPPAVTGTAQNGATLSTSDGTWTSSSAPTYAYQWQRCDGGGTCTNVFGATSATYVINTPDLGSRLRAVVTAFTTSGSNTGVSATSGVITAAPPTNTTAPVISGTARDGETLTATAGTWAGSLPIVYAYDWQRCDSGGANCASTGGTGSTYTLKSADVGATIRVAVTATNSAGTATVSSAATVTVVATAPVNTAAPVVTGTAQVGQTLSGSTGTWTGTVPLSYAYQWQRWGPGVDPNGPWAWGNIAGATTATYSPVPDDVDHLLRLVVTASNAAGTSSPASSGSTNPVTAAGPTNTGKPTITGTPQVGQTLTASPGTWSSTGTITYAYVWQRWGPPATGTNWVWSDIAGASANTYVPVADDANHTLRVVVTATDSTGSQTSLSDATAAVAP